MSKVSVLMCAYNEPLEYVRLSVDSILTQTYGDFEFIIVCDNPDNITLRNLLNDYCQKDSRIKLVVNEGNIGFTKSLNRGLSYCTGEYIVRIDADDISMPERIEKQVGFMDSNTNVAASGTNAYAIDSMGNIKGQYKRSSSSIELRSKIIFESPIFHPSAIFKRVLGVTPVTYNENFKYSQDYALWVSLLERGYTLSNLQEKLIYYRTTENQISTFHHEEQQMFAMQNQVNGIKALKLSISEEGILIFGALSRLFSNSFQNEEIENFIMTFLDINKDADCDMSIIRKRLILLYSNYLPKYYSFSKSITSLLHLYCKMNKFDLYSILSLIKKYM